jgi:hypothetical protein
MHLLVIRALMKLTSAVGKSGSGGTGLNIYHAQICAMMCEMIGTVQ